ncbi:ZIP family metal transporter [Celeribacter litoreus]|uniref:ZIP family metal transporter n=1 Tax=Celeribacter litoreus TaxID=2876714 RepID=UPI001CCE8B1A|nr:ZIP family metal transporter [Celeribacter litoreus]MCA0044198.1 ZIP family metal transporter [Celeribacter litoreus]
MDIIWIGIMASMGAGLMTGVGAIPVLFGKTMTKRTNDMLLGFAAGVMISASYFSLILPGLDAADELYGKVVISAAIAGAGIALGAGIVALLNNTLPHEHFITGPDGADPGALAKIWLFIIAITIHNFPEGMAVGIGFGGGDVTNGMSLATGIGLQNAPEGLAVAVALRGQGYNRWKSFGLALLTGLVEPVGGALGVGLIHVSVHVLPWGLSFAAGAMLYIISHEIIPETHRNGYQNYATTGLLAGLILMMFLDVTLG